MRLEELPDEVIVLGAHACDWRDAVHLAGDALVAGGVTTDAYTERMVQVVEEFGAYIVIAPGLALAHARPGPDVVHDGLAVVTLDEPVAFGHPHNDPVEVVLALAVTSNEGHVTVLADLANVFNDPTATRSIAQAATVGRVRAVLGQARPEP
ncbi:PTS sugar transporter subunit IIA [Agreia bicolorata]|uniref:Ascorbate-specific PTS system EIIA component n=1 Tax=Agreia bicolorata TaxID=110935 RepID=A0ABR5CEU2_9MICO|nr:PTS sugar transporter subunit IIA [Agreia bicolorata]KJC64120.1 PTS ascorbate transporter subunit IIA [Agreia bicolorata]